VEDRTLLAKLREQEVPGDPVPRANPGEKPGLLVALQEKPGLLVALQEKPEILVALREPRVWRQCQSFG
jgi:hypothetical protein